MAFYLAGNAARRTDPQLAELYHRLMTRAGHCHAQAIIAMSQKLAERTLLRRPDPEQLSDPAHRGPLRLLLRHDLSDHPNRPLLQLRRVPPSVARR